MRTFLEDIWYGVYEDKPDSQESNFYWDEFFKDIEKFTNPKYDKNSVSNHFYGIVAPYGRAQHMDGFRLGIVFAMRLAAESFYTPEVTRREAEQDYKNYQRCEVEEIGGDEQ